MSAFVIPAKAGTQEHRIMGCWRGQCSRVPAFAGMTVS